MRSRFGRMVTTAAFAGLMAGCANANEVALQTGQSASSIQSGAADVGEATDRTRALRSLGETLERLYVFPEWGRAYAAHLERRTLTNAEIAMPRDEFAALITGELNAIHHDAHLRLEVEEQESGAPEGLPPMPPAPPSSLKALVPLGEGIAYVRFDTLWGDPETMSALGELAAGGEARRGLIIDLRKNRGGGLSEIDLLASHLFSSEQDLLVMEGGPFREGPTLSRIESPEPVVRLLHRALPVEEPLLAETKVVILISKDSASAAEHFALAFKRTGRATLIGEATKGAAHFGGLMPIGGGFRAFVPAGRTYDPDTGQSWETVGVSPDVESEPHEALQLALETLGLGDEAIEMIGDQAGS